MQPLNRAVNRPKSSPHLNGLLRSVMGRLDADAAGGRFDWVRERLRVLSARTPTQAVSEYGQLARSAPLDDAQRYGLAVAHLEAGLRSHGFFGCSVPPGDPTSEPLSRIILPKKANALMSSG